MSEVNQIAAIGRGDVFAFDLHPIARRQVHPRPAASQVVDDVDRAVPGDDDAAVAHALLVDGLRRHDRHVEFFEAASVGVNLLLRGGFDPRDRDDFRMRALARRLQRAAGLPVPAPGERSAARASEDSDCRLIRSPVFSGRES